MNLPDIFKEVGFGEVLEKFQAKVGETRQWAGGQYKKVAPGKWEKVPEGGKAQAAPTKLPEHPDDLSQHLAGTLQGRKVGGGVVTMSKTPQALVARIKTARGALENAGYHVDDTGTKYTRGDSVVTLHAPHQVGEGQWAFALAVGQGAEKSMSFDELIQKANDDATTMPSSDDLKDQARRFLMGHMESLANISSKMGDKEEREHERKRVGQEWDKIAHDKRSGASEEEAWHAHLVRMQRMAESLGDPDKALRRARHMEAAGFSAAAKFFYARAQKLGAEVPEMEKSAATGNLEQFNEWVTKQGHKYIKRVQQPDGTYRYYYDVPAGVKPRMDPGERELARFAGPEQPGGGGRELVSPHHSRPYRELREMSMVAHLGEDAYVPKAKQPANAPVKWVKYNKDVGALEGQAKAYHIRGMKMDVEYGKSEAERKLWLATSLMFRDAAKSLATKRDLVTVPSAEKPPSAESSPTMQPMT